MIGVFVRIVVDKVIASMIIIILRIMIINGGIQVVGDVMEQDAIIPI